MKITVQDYTWQIILNPFAMSHKSGDYWNQIEEYLKNLKISYQYHITEQVSEAKFLISTLLSEGKRHFMVIGGDGTFNNFVNAVMESTIAPNEVFMIPIIMGTGNDWARTHFAKNTFTYTREFIASGSFTNHDIGLVEVFKNDLCIEKKHFLNIAGFGFDAEIIKNTMDKKPKLLPQAVYLFSLFTTLMSQKNLKVQLKIDDKMIEKEIISLAVGIGQFNGNGMKQCPSAIPNDHFFEMIVIDKVSKFKVIKNVKNLYDGSHIEKLNEITSYKASTIEIKANPNIIGEVEGELLPLGNYKISNINPGINILSEKWN